MEGKALETKRHNLDGWPLLSLLLPQVSQYWGERFPPSDEEAAGPRG